MGTAKSRDSLSQGCCPSPLNIDSSICFPFLCFSRKVHSFLLTLCIRLSGKRDIRGSSSPRAALMFRQRWHNPLCPTGPEATNWSSRRGTVACALSATLAPGTLGTCHSSCLVPGLLLPHYPCHPGRSLPALLALLGAYLGFASKHLFFPPSLHSCQPSASSQSSLFLSLGEIFPLSPDFPLRARS